MYQIDNSTAAVTQPASTAAGTPGFFTDGNPAAGLQATIVPAEWLNAVMLELKNSITASGQTLDKTKFNQLALAMAAQSPGRLLNMRSLSGAGSVVPSNGAVYGHIRGCGAGGGGQASSSSGGGNGTGGGGGGYFEWFGPLSALGPGPSFPYVVGAAGPGGATSGQLGAAGGNTSFGGLLTAGGGGGGGVNVGGNLSVGGTVSISVAGALLMVPGREGQGPVVGTIGGVGGNSFAGPGGVPHTSGGGAGVAGGGGAGGGGNSGVNSGGNGSAGYLIFSEYAG
jgi:hypothetical protein